MVARAVKATVAKMTAAVTAEMTAATVVVGVSGKSAERRTAVRYRNAWSCGTTHSLRGLSLKAAGTKRNHDACSF